MADNIVVENEASEREELERLRAKYQEPAYEREELERLRAKYKDISNQPSASQQVADILANQSQYPQNPSHGRDSAPQMSRSEYMVEGLKEFPGRVYRGVTEGIPEMLTGNKRETEATRNLPELGSQMSIGELLGEDSGFLKNLGVSAALLTTFNPVEIVKIIEENASEPVGVQSDEAGNIIINVGGRRAILNKPGMSGIDATQLAAATAEFTPASTAKTVGLSGIGRVAGKSGLVQAGNETLQASQGGEFNTGDVALVSGLAGGFRGLGQLLANKYPTIFSEMQAAGVTATHRQLIRKEAEALGIKASELSDEMIEQMVRETRAAVSPQEALAVQGEQEFGIPLTRGQRSLDDSQLMSEDMARSGVKGDQPQKIIRDFEVGTQRPAVNRAVDEQVDNIGGDKITSQQQAGATVRQGIRDAEQAAYDVVEDAYEQVGEASLNAENASSLLGRTAKALDGDTWIKDLPRTASVLKYIADRKKILDKQLKAVADGKLTSADSHSIHQLNNIRKRIGNEIRAAENTQDRAQLIILRQSFDDQMDEMVINGLFSGDQAAVNQLRQAQGLFAEYAKKFRAQDSLTKGGRRVRDSEGAFIDKIVSADPTDEQVINALFGASNFSNKAGKKMAERFQLILGKDSEGWKQIRQAGFRRLVKTNTVNGEEIVSGQQTLNAINKAMDENASLMKALYTNEEIATMKRLALQIQRTQAAPVRSRANPSGSGVMAVKSIGDILSRLLGMLGVVDGGATYAVTGAGVKAAGNMTAKGAAREAVRPFKAVSQPSRKTGWSGVTLGIATRKGMED